jgi:hypothetical protein
MYIPLKEPSSSIKTRGSLSQTPTLSESSEYKGDSDNTIKINKILKFMMPCSLSSVYNYNALAAENRYAACFLTD